MTTTDQVEVNPVAVDPATPPHVPAPGGSVAFHRLLHVELRKLVDTRAGRWLLIAIGIVTAVVVVVMLLTADGADMTLGNFFGATAIPQAILLPVLGILAVTSEWSQRTGLVTFTLEPRRGRVALAKLVAAVILGLLAVVVALGLAAAANVAAGALAGGDGSWHLSGSILSGVLLLQVLGVAQGVAFGMLLLNTPAAIVAYFALPTVWSVLGTMVSWLHDAAQWLDLNTTGGPLVEGAMDAAAWQRLAASVGLWIVLPLLAGAWRLTRREVK